MSIRYRRQTLRPLLMAGLVFGLGLGASGCALFRSDRGGREPLPPPPPGEVKPSDYTPRNGFEMGEGGIATRTVYREAQPLPFSLEVQQFLVPPGRQRGSVPLEGRAAILEVRAGVGVALVNGKAQELAPGTVVAVSAGDQLQLEARGEPLVIQAQLVGAR